VLPVVSPQGNSAYAFANARTHGAYSARFVLFRAKQKQSSLLRGCARAVLSF
jgi:hypothetical protein